MLHLAGKDTCCESLTKLKDTINFGLISTKVYEQYEARCSADVTQAYLTFLREGPLPIAQLLSTSQLSPSSFPVHSGTEIIKVLNRQEVRWGNRYTSDKNTVRIGQINRETGLLHGIGSRLKVEGALKGELMEGEWNEYEKLEGFG